MRIFAILRLHITLMMWYSKGARHNSQQYWLEPLFKDSEDFVGMSLGRVLCTVAFCTRKSRLGMLLLLRKAIDLLNAVY